MLTFCAFANSFGVSISTGSEKPTGVGVLGGCEAMTAISCSIRLPIGKALQQPLDRGIATVAKCIAGVIGKLAESEVCWLALVSAPRGCCGQNAPASCAFGSAAQTPPF